MSWFQNPFAEDFRGSLVLGDRQHIPSFLCPCNAGRGQEIVISWGTAPYTLSGTDADGNHKHTLSIQYAFSDSEFKRWQTLNVTGTGSTVLETATTPDQVVAALNSDTSFANLFTAETKPSLQPTTRIDGTVVPSTTSAGTAVVIKQNFPISRMRFYIVNGLAESVLLFNARAGVAELPSYFARHTSANASTFTDSCNTLIALNTGLGIDAAIIDAAVDYKGVTKGFSSGTTQTDAQLMKGKSGIFNYQKLTVDGSDRITEIIEYPTGAVVGDLARKISYTYTATNLNPDTIKEIPYTLTSGDLI
jgi:hypothetical protein